MCWHLAKFVNMNESNLGNIRNTQLEILFKKLFGVNPIKKDKIKIAGSNRVYFRLWKDDKPVIGTIADDLQESATFHYLSDHFGNSDLPVPKVLIKNEAGDVYLQQDLGNEALFDLVLKTDCSKGIPAQIEDLYKKTLACLIRFQIDGAIGLDFNQCYPRQAFDRQSMQWDLNYFKYYFLRPTAVKFNEQRLESDFKRLMDFLLKAPADFFMYRDFQARNILIRKNEPWFIDYQGGRKGPLQYDVASLLFQAKANLPFDFREKMMSYYLDQLENRIEIHRQDFTKQYFGFVLLRTLQVLGAYGFRGYFEQKPHFVSSIKFALANLQWLVNNVNLPVMLPELDHCFEQMLSQPESAKKDKLQIEINSFSYLKSGIPKDTSGHGGGFVFDCRILPNPGRYAEYKNLNGKDKPVIDFLNKEPAVAEFSAHIKSIIDQAVDNYVERGFDKLTVNFGCTGGQHRSVYFAELLSKHLRQRNDIKLSLTHKMEPWS